MERILAAHSQVRAMGELLCFSQAMKQVIGFADKSWLIPAGPSAAADPSAVAAIYRRNSSFLCEGAAYAIDKLPHNTDYLGAIRLALPDAIIIHLRRSPMDSLFSAFRRPFYGTFDWSFSQADLAAHHRNYRALMQHWRTALDGEGFIEVDYRDLVSDSEAQIRRVLAACGLPFEAACLDPRNAGGAVATASTAQVRRPINREGLGTWRRYAEGLAPLRELLQLPVLFDGSRLAEEIGRIPENAWRPHPQGFAGNDALPLITVDGDPSSDGRSGPMAPTEYLLDCPYLMQVLGALGATWGRSRLMRLSGSASVDAHVDTDYYWRDHMRVHVPIVTQPSVRFYCGDQDVHMAAGECWIFDTWSVHHVENDDTHARIHLVADTVGGDGLLTLMEGGRTLGEQRPDWAPRQVSPADGGPVRLAYEARNTPLVMTPWEVRDHILFLLSEAVPGSPQLQPVAQILNRFSMSWHSRWAAFGEDPAGRPAYEKLLAETWRQLSAQRVDELLLKNEMSFGRSLRKLIFNVALSGAQAEMDSERREAPGKPATPSPLAAPREISPAVVDQGAAVRPAATVGAAASSMSELRVPPLRAGPLFTSTMAFGGSKPTAAPASSRVGDPMFDRPIFIVSSPRSGSTLLFETLAQAAALYTVGGEAHALMEGIPAINPANRGYDSNRLTAADADAVTLRMLRERFRSELRDRGGVRPRVVDRVRMLEKTPKNALRIPFLAKAFPEARFVYLYRDPRQTLASMIEAWLSGRFQTYPRLPGWNGPPWSLLLVPGWRELNGKPLKDIVARQWATTTRILLQDLEALPADRWCPIRYDRFIGSPQSEIQALCQALGLTWDGPLASSLPLARHTVTPPDPEKWRAHAADIEAALPSLAGEMAKAEALVG